MKSEDLLVSIIIPVYNAEEYLEEALDSCLQQTYGSIEIIGVDNNSTDNSREILLRYARNYPDKIKVFAELEPGAPAARNRGLKEAGGEYIHFLDADDVLIRNAIEVLLGEMSAGFDAVSGGEIYYKKDCSGSPEFQRKRIENEDHQIADILYNHPNTGAVLLRRTALESVKWDNSLGAAQELVFWAELVLTNNIRFKYIPETVCKIRIHESPSRISNQDRRSKALNKYLAILKIEVLLRSSPFKSSLSEIALNDFKLRHAFKAIHARNFQVAHLLFSRVNKGLIKKSANFRWYSKEGIACVSNLYVGFIFYYLNYRVLDRMSRYFYQNAKSA